jgi:hypothetical protein
MPVKSPNPGDKIPKVYNRRQMVEVPTHYNVPLRDWAMGSYDPNTGRSHSSIADYQGKGPLDSNHVGSCNPQIPDAFAARDARCTQEKTPVSRRAYTKVVD